MLLAAAGTPFNVHDQLQAIKTQLADHNKKDSVRALQSPMFHMSTAKPPPADIVSLAWANGVPVQA